MNLGLKPSDYRLLRHEKEFGSLLGRLPVLEMIRFSFIDLHTFFAFMYT
jgi:hypothetical protein